MQVDVSSLALCAVVLFVKMFAISLYQGWWRIGQGAFTNPEDAATFSTNAPLAEDLPAVQRAAACWRNDLENIPIFLLLGLLYLMAGGSADSAAVYFWTFTVARIAHTASYLAGLQPWRTLAFGVGMFSTIGLAVRLVMVL